ncbi:MAG: capping complex subunit for YIEGIA [Symbiobacteriia bacterium]
MPSLENLIIAAVTVQPGRVQGGVPIFQVDDGKAAQTLANILAHVLDGMVHDLGNDTLIIVRH